MSLVAASSGLAGLLTDAREFLAGVRLARPDALWLLLLLPVLGLLNRWAARQRRSAVAAIGRPAAVSGQLTNPRPPRGARRWLGLAYPLAWLLLIVGVAGPRWGTSDEAGVAVGRDLVIVIDLSRSMLADDMSDPNAKTRWEAARAGALDLRQAVARRGGHRVAVVVFAAKPKVLCPLTTDYEYVRAVLDELDGKHPPPEIRPGNDPNVVSGTRIGAALVAAVQAHDERFAGAQDIVLISDGDDPARDKEWLIGSSAATARHIPVHTVGVGGVTTPAVLEFGTEVQDLVGTMLQEEPLKQVAEDTHGVYLAARRNTPNLGEFFRTRIEPNPSREYTGGRFKLTDQSFDALRNKNVPEPVLSKLKTLKDKELRQIDFESKVTELLGADEKDPFLKLIVNQAYTGDQIPQPKERYAWLLAAALVLFSIGWLRGR